MARLESIDKQNFFELTPVHVTRARGDSGDADEVVCEVKFESYGEPVEGEAALTRAGLTRMIEKLKKFCEKQTGMMQLRSQTQDIEMTLAAKRSKWTQKLRVTGLAGVPQEEQEQEEESSLRVSFGVAYREAGAAGGAVEHRAGMFCTFNDLSSFATGIEKEFEAAPTRRRTGQVQPPGE
jgi:hypothetical protein